MTTNTANPTRIVILGGGFGGAYVAQALEKYARKHNLEITLIDKRNYFIFYPLLVEAGIGSLEPRHAVVSLHDYLKHTSLMMGEVAAIDDEKREVTCKLAGTAYEKKLKYDHLVVGLGSVTRLLPVPGLKEYGLKLKSIGDSVGLRDRVIQLLEIANHIEDPSEREEWLNLIVVGASYTGVEVAGEFQAFMSKAAENYPNISGRDIKVHLVEAAENILPTLEPGLAEYARESLEKRGVDIRLKQTVESLHASHVVMSTGEKIPTRTVVWCAGIAPNPILKEMPFSLNDHGYLDTQSDLRVKGTNHVWGIGDNASIPGPDGSPYAPTAQNATRQARHAAKNIMRVVKGEEPQPCEITPLGSLASIGCRSAVAKVFGIRLSGFLAWWLWRTVYLSKMPTFSRKLRVTFDWTAGLIFSHDIVQLGVHELTRLDEKSSHDLRIAAEEKKD